eukprot:GGOE01027207.1.p1 GENE.GGOE01027207.1~~GGOE01027207.1.p1  ORF type:complete len:388 (-),score=98.33 GGOE01027207.1:492-1655(-)
MPKAPPPLIRRLTLLQDSEVDYLDIHCPTDPMTWHVKLKGHSTTCSMRHAIKPMSKGSSDRTMNRLVRLLSPGRPHRSYSDPNASVGQPLCSEISGPPFEALARIHPNLFISVMQDQLGQHSYVSAIEAQHYVSAAIRNEALPQVRLWLEDDVKMLTGMGSAAAVNARLVDDDGGPPIAYAQKPSKLVHPVASDMCPNQGGRGLNYHCIEDLTLGPTQRVLLADEGTLNRGDPRVPIFKHIVLIVNTHEDESSAQSDKYRVGDNPDVIYQPIHKLWNTGDETVAHIMHNIQVKVWQALQRGSVVSHCLAGLHRAPTVVVCQFLYRYYALKMYDTCNDVEAIYRRIQAVRPHAEPLSYIAIIRKYEKWLMTRFPLSPETVKASRYSVS